MKKRAAGGGTRSPEVRRRILVVAVLLTAAVTAGRAFQLGVLEGERWRAKALDQQGDTLTLAAPRGTIYDRDGVPLAASHEVYRIALAPRQVEDRDALAQLLRAHLNMSAREATRYLSPDRSWVVLPGRYSSDVRERLDDVAGVYLEHVQQRFYPNGNVARELLGLVRMDGVAQGGLELEYDSILSGRPGRAVVRRDSRGRPLPGTMLRAIEPTAGRDLYLTIDYDLQEIADQALTDALEHTNALGGELVIADPRTGELLAAVSRGRDGRARNWRAVTEPYEPGSTIKPFTVAALLALGRATLSDSVYGENGRYEELALSDVHAYGWITLGEGLRKSSNIALAKMGARLEPSEHFATLRDFGFGSPTGVSYPSESAGRLPRPANWSRTSSSRLSIGYEISTTPLQMAMAYGALANGGVLFEPRLVREVRLRDGRVDRTYAPRVVRRVITEETAQQLRIALIDAVQEGSGAAAGLGSFAVAGKTGTARIAARGGYRAGAYIASFAGFFPAHDPQLVIIVKLDEPRGEYYGGLAAAPVTRATLEAALAAHSTPIDRLPIARPASLPALSRPLAAADVQPSMPAQVITFSDRTAAGRTVGAGTARAQSPADVAQPVPDVAGMTMRDGVRRLHAAGFRLRLEGSGRVVRTIPAAGAAWPVDVVVRVIGEVSA